MKLDELSDSHRTVIEGFSEMDDSESESDEERSDPVDNQSENVDIVAHDIALASITNKRRAVRIRNFEGETISSYSTFKEQYQAKKASESIIEES